MSAVVEWIFQMEEETLAQTEPTQTEPTLGKPPSAFVCGGCFGSGVTHDGECSRCKGVGNLPYGPPPRSA